MFSSIKKFPLKTVLLTLLGWILFWEIKETITRERMTFIARWIYSDRRHAKDIEVKTYTMTDDQVLEMLAHPNEEIEQLTEGQIALGNGNIVLRIRNLKDGHAWGRLLWKVPYSSIWDIVDVPYIPAPGMKEKYATIIMSQGGHLPMPRYSDDLPEPITTKWESLYISH